jgi:nucleoside-diphosphate-sugar epimerase
LQPDKQQQPPNRPFFFELCLTLIYEDQWKDRPEMALTVMDGELVSLYPMKDGSPGRKVTLTSVKYSPLKKSTSLEELQALSKASGLVHLLIERRQKFEELISHYYPFFHQRYTYQSYFLSYKTKPMEASDNRECFTDLVAPRVIDVWSGKINAIFDAETMVARLIGAPVRQPLGQRAALIGFTGFVGSSIARQGQFTHFFNSKNIRDIQGQHFDLICCAGAPGVKWWANQHPEEDKASIDLLVDCLRQATAEQFLLISTIDVYPTTRDLSEEFFTHNPDVNHHHQHAYGRHRLELERFVLQQFPSHSSTAADTLIVRLPALFGTGLRKNYVFDLLHSNNVERINPSTQFQWYDMSDFLHDVTAVWAHNNLAQQKIRTINFFTQPISTSDIIERCFPELDESGGADTGGNGASYDLWTNYGWLFASTTPHYIRTRDEILTKLEAFVKTEKKKITSL